MPPPSPPRGGGTFGRILLDLGLLTEEQLDRALDLQRERSRRGDFARLGHILVEMGFLTPAQVQQVLQAQAITILSCEACGAQYNIRGYSPQLRYECPKCHNDLRPAPELENVVVQDQLQVSSDSDDDTVRLTRADVSNTAKIRQLRLLGKYEILGEIARGGMGIIYKARQLDLERVVALKTLRQEELAKPDAAARFRGEAQAVARLRHPNIVAVHEVGSYDGIEYFTMEFIEGLPLDRRVLREEIEPRRAVEMILPIAEALEYAHRMGVVHRDLKPANIIIDQEGTPFLVDWGIAERTDKGLAADEEEDLLGSIPYMAPEYVEGAAYDEGCDLYSLGVVLYEVLAGPNCLPYYDADTRRFLEKIMAEPPTPIRERVPELDPELASIVERMIAPRDERYAAMRAASADLRRWLVRHDPEAETRSAPRPPLPLPLEPAAPSADAADPAPAGPRWLVPALVAGLVLVGGALLWSVAALQDARAEARALRQDLVEQDRAYAGQLLGLYLSEANRLVDAGREAEAIRLCTRVIDAWGDRGFAELADVYRLRGELRGRRGDPGAVEDEAKAQKLSGNAGSD